MGALVGTSFTITLSHQSVAGVPPATTRTRTPRSVSKSRCPCGSAASREVRRKAAIMPPPAYHIDRAVQTWPVISTGLKPYRVVRPAAKASPTIEPWLRLEIEPYHAKGMRPTTSGVVSSERARRRIGITSQRKEALLTAYGVKKPAKTPTDPAPTAVTT